MYGKLPNLLLVEDDTELGPLMVEMLNEQYNVHWARSLRAARDANVGTEYAACIIDRRLPDGTGRTSSDSFDNRETKRQH